MKKITALLLVVLMLAAMSVAVFARYEVCPDCNSRMTSKTTEKVVDSVTCEKTGDPTMQDDVIEVTTVLKCTSCTHREVETYTYTDCHH